MNFTKKLIKNISIGLFCVSLVTGCASNTATITSGILLGGLAGAATCFADKSCKKIDSVIARSAAGATVGGAIGWGINQISSKKTENAQTTAKALGYSQAQGTLVKFQATSVQPEMITPGKPVSLHMEYTVLTPNNQVISVEEKWVISYNGQVMKELKAPTKSREPGRWHSNISINLPNKLSPGTYVITNHIQSGTRYDVAKSILYVNKQV